MVHCNNVSSFDTGLIKLKIFPIVDFNMKPSLGVPVLRVKEAFVTHECSFCDSTSTQRDMYVHQPTRQFVCVACL